MLSFLRLGSGALAILALWASFLVDPVFGVFLALMFLGFVCVACVWPDEHTYDGDRW